MTPKEKLIAVKKAEQEFFYKVSLLKKDYRHKIREISHSLEGAKIANVKKQLGL
jgi:hypothetical protein